MFIMRNLRAQYSGDIKYKPEEMPEGKYIPVIGFTTKKRTKTDKNNNTFVVDEPYLIMIGNDGKSLECIMFNLRIMIDEK